MVFGSNRFITPTTTAVTYDHSELWSFEKSRIPAPYMVLIFVSRSILLLIVRWLENLVHHIALNHY